MYAYLKIIFQKLIYLCFDLLDKTFFRVKHFCVPVISYIGKAMYLQAEDVADMKKWIEALNDASRITVS